MESPQQSDNGTIGDVNCKIVLVGDARCGKTALIHRFITDSFHEFYTPTGFEKYSACYNVADQLINFTVWDTSGSPAYDTVRHLAYADTRVFLLCFQIGDPDSLDNAVNKWYPEIRQHCQNTPVILCGCQSDLRSDISTISALTRLRAIPVTSEQALSVSRQLSAVTYVETSAKCSSRGAREAFEVGALAALGKLNKVHLHQMMHQQQRHFSQSHSRSRLDLKSELKDRARNCAIM